jgi:hypothetical protein
MILVHVVVSYKRNLRSTLRQINCVIRRKSKKEENYV